MPDLFRSWLAELGGLALLGADALAWPGGLGSYADDLPYEVRGMLRSRANTSEGSNPRETS